MQKRYSKSAGCCPRCANTIQPDVQCACERMLLKNTELMDQGAFYMPFTHVVRQFLDIKSHFALLATCQIFYAMYKDLNALSRSSTHFALSPSLKPEFRNELGWHPNPIVAISPSIILRLFNGVLSACSQIDDLPYPTLVDTQFAKNKKITFKPLALGDNIQGKISGLVFATSAFFIWTNANKIYVGDVKNSGRLTFQEVNTGDKTISHNIIKIVPIMSYSSIFVVTDEKDNQVYLLSMKPPAPYSVEPFGLKVKISHIVHLPPKNALLYLTEEGKILARGDITHDYGNSCLPVGNYSVLTPVFTEVTDRHRIIGLDSGEKYIVAWSDKQIFAIGTKHPYYGGAYNHENFANIKFPVDFNGNIVNVVAGRDHILVYTEQGEVYSAGFNYGRQLGRGASRFFKNDFDGTLRKVEELPDNIVSINTGSNAQSAFSTYNGRLFLCGSTQTATQHYYRDPEFERVAIFDLM